VQSHPTPHDRRCAVPRTRTPDAKPGPFSFFILHSIFIISDFTPNWEKVSLPSNENAIFPEKSAEISTFSFQLSAFPRRPATFLQKIVKPTGRCCRAAHYELGNRRPAVQLQESQFAWRTR
jgi:hypothetical protein